MALKRSIALCYRQPMRFFAALALALTCAIGQAQPPPGRLLPQGKLGEMTGGQLVFPLVKIGSETLRLTAGALVFDQNNRTITHNNLPAAATVLYVQEQSGDVSRIYIL